jgi:hypothetical protein
MQARQIQSRDSSFRLPDLHRNSFRLKNDSLFNDDSDARGQKADELETLKNKYKQRDADRNSNSSSSKLKGMAMRRDRMGTLFDGYIFPQHNNSHRF